MVIANDKSHKGKNRIDWREDTTADVTAADDDDEIPTTSVALSHRYTVGTRNTMDLLDERVIPYDLIVRLLERICFEDVAMAPYSPAILVFLPGLGEIRRLHDLLVEHHRFSSDQEFVIYPLHSTISGENQNAVFDIPPPGIRKVVIGNSFQ